MTRLRRWGVGAGVGLGSAVILGACFPDYEIARGGGGSDATSDGVSGESGDDGPSSADVADGHAPDGGADSGDSTTIGVGDAPLDDGAVPVVSAGSKAYAVGFGHQTHLVYANHDHRYWLLYVDDTAGRIETRASSDLSTWTAGAPIFLPSGLTLSDGSQFSVAYADLGGADVVHVVLNATSTTPGDRYAAFHVRATISGGVITASPAETLPDTDSTLGPNTSGETCPGSGPATLVTAGGTVYDISAWSSHSPTTTRCDTNIYRAPIQETGGGWDAAAFVHSGYFWAWPNYAYSHELVELPEAGVVLAVYPDQDPDTYSVYQTFGWALSSGFDAGGPGGPGDVGVDIDAAVELFEGSGSSTSYDDWCVCRLSDDAVHLVRHVMPLAGSPTVSSFDDLVFDGSSWHAATDTPPALTSGSDTGVALVSGTDPSRGMLRAVIAVDGSIDVAKWTAASGWSAATVIPAGSAPRRALAGTGCGSSHPALVWTEGSGSYTIAVADVSGLL